MSRYMLDTYGIPYPCSDHTYKMCLAWAKSCEIFNWCTGIPGTKIVVVETRFSGENEHRMLETGVHGINKEVCWVGHKDLQAAYKYHRRMAEDMTDMYREKV